MSSVAMLSAGARSFGLRRLAILSAAAFGAVIVVISATLIWTASVLGGKLDVVARDTASSTLAVETESRVLMYQRLSNLYLITREPAVDGDRQALLGEVEALLARAGELVGSRGERRLLDGLAEDLSAYRQARQTLESQGLALEDVVRGSTPALVAVLGRLQDLRDVNEAQLARARQEAARVNRTALVASAIAVVFVALGLAAITLGMRRHLLSPVLALHRSVRSFSAGNLDARATENGASEVRDLARQFNRMAGALAKQREAQLAFLAGVAHDLKNPLNAVKLGIYNLEREPSELRRARTRALLDKQVMLLARMIDDLLDATRIEAGYLALNTQVFDFASLITDVIDVYAPTAPDHHIQVERPPHPVPVRADPSRVEQVVSNLLSNAIKYSPLGATVVVRLSTAPASVVLEVADNGVGIPPEEIEGLFLPFRRHRADLAPGAGLGLSVVKRIVEGHGGRIEVHSRLEAGSTFRVYLPRIAGAAAGDSAA